MENDLTLERTRKPTEIKMHQTEEKKYQYEEDGEDLDPNTSTDDERPSYGLNTM